MHVKDWACELGTTAPPVFGMPLRTKDLIWSHFMGPNLKTLIFCALNSREFMQISHPELPLKILGQIGRNMINNREH